MTEVQDRVVGLLVGLAAGDRIGGPVQMAVRVAESLRDRHTFDPEDIGARYLEWWRLGAFDTGPTTAAVLERVSSGMSFEDAASQEDRMRGGWTAGCNPAHRSAPLAMLATLQDDRLAQAAKTEASLTHKNPLAGDVAAAVVVLCRALIRGQPWEHALDVAAVGCRSETRRALVDRRADNLSRGGFAPDVLRAAIFFVDTSPSFAIALSRSLDFAGGPNYSPVLVGSIAGARWGQAAIDERQLRHHTSSVLSRLRSVAGELAAGWTGAGCAKG